MNRKPETLAAENTRNYPPDEKTRADFHARAVAESLVPIHPGVPGRTPFWNAWSTQFKHVPSFDFKTVTNVTCYRFTATSMADKKDYVFEAAEPWALLTPIWKNLPVGEVELKVEGLDRKGGTVLGSCGKPRKFWRSAVFNGPYQPPARPYLESVRMSLQYLFNQPALTVWKDGGPDPADPAKLIAAYGLYYYPEIMIDQVIRLTVVKAKFDKGTPGEEEALRILNSTFNYLQRISEPKDAPLAYFPPSYRGMPEGGVHHPSKIMMTGPVRAGEAYLDAYELTRDKRFLEAACRIADTYARTQLPNGTWPLMADRKTGKSGEDTKSNLSGNLLVPTDVILFFDRIEKILGTDAYAKPREASLAWMMENPVRTFDWRTQCEDVAFSTPYRDHFSIVPAAFAIYLLEHKDKNKDYRALAEELLRFVEDQFVVWELPFPETTVSGAATTQFPPPADKARYTWLTSCGAMEQYVGYYPIDAVAAYLVSAWQRAYLATGDNLYLAKATTLANAMTQAQDPKTGYFPTYWITNVGSWWLNCAAQSTRNLFDFARMIAEKR